MNNYNMRFLDIDEIGRINFAEFGNNVSIDQSVRIIGAENISIGNNVRIDAGSILIATGKICIGSWVHISANCLIEGRGGVVISDFAGLSAFVSLLSISDDFSGQSLTNPMVPEQFKTLRVSEVVLERHALVGTKATVLPGVRIGEGSVLGAHSLATKSIPPWAIYAGTPARFIKGRSREMLKLEGELLREQGQSRT